jgi:UDP-glucose 4-epimerase
MKVVVTGGAGFIGAHVCRELLARGAVVIVVDDLSTGYLDNLAALPVDLRIASVADGAAVGAAISGADAVVHLAAVSSVPLSLDQPERTHLVNVSGTLTVLEAARAVGAHVVLASSAAVYGDHPAALKSEHLPVRPLSPYAASKVAAETYATSWQKAFGLPTLAFRFFNVFGPLQPPGHIYAAVVPAFIAAATAGRPLQIYGDGRQTRDFVPVGVVARLVADVLERRVSHPTPVNLALGGRTSLLELAGLLELVMGRTLAREHTEPRAGDVRDSRADGTLLRELFPVLPVVSIVDCLRDAVAWWGQLT